MRDGRVALKCRGRRFGCAAGTRLFAFLDTPDFLLVQVRVADDFAVRARCQLRCERHSSHGRLMTFINGLRDFVLLRWTSVHDGRLMAITVDGRIAEFLLFSDTSRFITRTIILEQLPKNKRNRQFLLEWCQNACGAVLFA